MQQALCLGVGNDIEGPQRGAFFRQRRRRRKGEFDSRLSLCREGSSRQQRRDHDRAEHLEAGLETREEVDRRVRIGDRLAYVQPDIVKAHAEADVRAEGADPGE